MKRIIALLSAAVMCLGLFTGCSETTGKIASSVAEAARMELEVQVKAALEEHKLEVIEIKTAFGKLNDDGSEYQFFIGALVKSNATAVPQSTADTMGRIFSDAGLTAQTESALKNEHLVHKNITFKQTDFSAGSYYVIWGYAADLTVELPDLSALIEATTGK
jgi:hypothetical protein